RSASTRPRRTPTVRTIVRKRVMSASIVDETRSSPGPPMPRTFGWFAAPGNSSSRTSRRCEPEILGALIRRSALAIVVPWRASRPRRAPSPRIGKLDVRDRVQIDVDAMLPHDTRRPANGGQEYVAGRPPTVAVGDDVHARAGGRTRRQRLVRDRLA